MQKIKQTITGFNIQNRKYIGSKSNLLIPLLSSIVEKVDNIESFADIFAGTGIVTDGISKMFPTAKLIVNDMLYSNYIIYQAFFGCRENEVDIPKLFDILEDCNQKSGYYGYVTHNFGGSYFTQDNAKLIDQIRDHIEQLYFRKAISFKEKCVLIASLLYAADKVANTCGQYDSFLKHLGSKTIEAGIHKVDSNVYKRLELRFPSFSFNYADNLIVSMDANLLVENINPQIVYIDPPYNTRQYIDNYHILENISRWQKPQVYGKTKKFERDELKSKYSQVKNVRYVFETLIKHIRSEHIFVSYNSEGLLSESNIYEILSKKGKVSVTEIPYVVFGNGAGQSKKRPIIEYLFHVYTK